MVQGKIRDERCKCFGMNTSIEPINITKIIICYENGTKIVVDEEKTI